MITGVAYVTAQSTEKTTKVVVPVSDDINVVIRYTILDVTTL